MSVGIERWTIAGLVAILAALTAFAAVADKAGATTVNPANQQIVASNASQDPTWFVPNNAYGNGLNPGDAQTGVGCSASTATLTVPPDDLGRPNWVENENNPGVGSHSQWSGSVITDLAADFDVCEVYQFVQGAAPAPTGVLVLVTTPGPDLWTVAGGSINENEASVAIGVPPEGAIVDIGPGLCEITVSPGRASSVMAKYDNVAEQLTVDGQVEIEHDDGVLCEPAYVNETVAQFEGVYDAPGLTIDP